MTAFEGIYTALITPMTSDHRLNEELYRKNIEFNIAAGIDGFWVAGGSGESVLLDDAENNRIAEIVTDQTRGRARIIMHVGAPTTARAARMAEAAADAGVDAICCVPPFFYPHGDAAVVAHYRTVAAAADLPFFAYNLPMFTGYEITPARMAKIQDGVPQLTGLKHSGLDFTHTAALVDMGLKCFIGRASLMLPALTVGAVGCVDGWPGVAPEIWVRLWRAYRAGEMAAAGAAQIEANKVCNLLDVGGGFIAVLKAAVSVQLGADCGAPRPPGQPLSAERHEALRARLSELQLLREAA